MRKSLTFLLLLALVLVGTADTAVAKKSKADETVAETEDETSPAEESSAKKKNEDPDFEETIEGFERVEGLFDFYRDDLEGKVYMEIRPEHLGQLYLCSITRSAGDGYYFDNGAMLGEFPFELQRIGKRIQFRHKNVYFRADGDTAISRAIARGVSDSIVGSAKIETAPHPETGALLIDASSFFVQDIANVGVAFSRMKRGFSMDRENSYFGDVRSFPENSEIDVVLHFESGKPAPAPTLPDGRSMFHTYHYSLSMIPDANFTPRVADDRVGHFLTIFQDYTSSLSDTPYVRYVNRWNLQKAEPKFESSVPREPIVFWLENTIPVEYREAVRQGILLWNDAFDSIGFKDAIVVKQQPDDADWDPADVRYSTVRWIVQPGGGYAVGPSRTNPFTGQIYDADIRVSSDMVRYVFQSFQELADPVARFASPEAFFSGGAPAAMALEEIGFGPGSKHNCDYLSGALQQASFGWSLLSARSMPSTSAGVDGEKYLNDFIITVIAHEVGHTLGLRHNFKASTLHANSQLQTEEAAAMGLTGSVMDYTPVNIAPEGEVQGDYWQTRLGPYDFWAIEYAYAPYDPNSGESEAAMLDRIAGKVAAAGLQYGTDEDAWFGPRGMDPLAPRYDLGSDQLQYHADRIALAKELWSKMESEFEKPGARYKKLRDVFGQGISQYFMSVLNVSKQIGGIYHYRDHVGDPDGRLPFAPVSAARQRQAMAFLTDNVFGPDAFDFPHTLLQKMAPERLPDFTGSVWRMARLDYPIHDVIRAIQTYPLNHLYNGLLLSRMLDWENGDEGQFTMAEMFGTLRDAIWAEAIEGDNINSVRRALQREHLDRLTRMVVSPPPGTPEDACTLARADLLKIGAAIEGSLSGVGLDETTRAHLDETRARIIAAVEAGIQRQTKF